MQFIAAIVLFWQRRRLIPLVRRGWASVRSTATADTAGGTLSRLAAVARRLLVNGWRAVDTDANASRLARFVSWMRTFAGGSDVVRTAAKPETSA